VNRRPSIRRPSLGTVLGFTALIVAVAGTASAGQTHVIVRKGDIAKGAVTAKALAKGAVHAKALAAQSVNARALANNSVSAANLKAGAVTPAALAPNAVTASALAPGSVYGGALGPVSLHVAPIADPDLVPSNPEWTASNTVTALCGVGERLLTGGVVFADPGNREVAIVQSAPFANASSSGYVGQITSNSGGKATAEVQALCLR
jgi:hypothetical protein